MANIALLGEYASGLVWNVVAAIIIYLVGKRLIAFALNGVEKATSKAGTDETLAKFLRSVIKIGLYVLLVFIIVSQLGVNTASLITVLGSAALAVGLALQGSLANFAGGVLILLTAPFKVGDYIVTGLGEGEVEEINLVCTKLLTKDKKVVIIPNSAISAAPITNCSTHPIRRVDISVPISADSDVTKARQIMEDCFNAHPDVIKDGTVASHLDDFVENGVTIAACGFTEGSKYWAVKWKLHEDIKAAFSEAGIVIPYNQMDVHVKND